MSHLIIKAKEHFLKENKKQFVDVLLFAALIVFGFIRG